MRSKKALRIIGVVMAFAMMLPLVISAQAQDMSVLRARLGSTDVPTLDPALATDSSSIQILGQTYIGLTVLDEETLDTQSGMATSWETAENDDGTVTFTFSLMQDIPWVRYDADSGEVVEVTDADGNVRMVTANDFVYGWKRTLDPATAAEYAYVLSPQVVGGDAFNTGDGTADDVAISAVDDYTLEVTAPALFAPQTAIYGLWMARPQPQWAIEEYGDFWIEAENFQSYGPYAVMDWSHDESLTIVKNPFWPGIESVPQAGIDEIQFYFLDESVALSQYEAGDLDHLDTVPSNDIDRLKSDPALSSEFTITPSTSTYYYGFDTRTESLTGNVNLRRALSYAVDRQSLIDNVVKGGQIPARWFSTPALAAAPTLESNPDMGVEYDPDLAREYLATALEEMGYASAEEVPTITLLFNTSENHARIAEAIQQMWADELGLDVQLTNQEFAVYLDSRQDFPIWRAGWGADYPDAANFIGDVFKSTSENNDTWFASEEMDSLIDEAAALTDNDARRELYAQAEQILVFEGAAIIPIYWGTKLNMTKPNIERTFSLQTGENYYKWSIN
ncbi:MAG: peptide ABC transporter substrate-binding protein [Anaerolineae bacterium]|nr:peptide ABC transporter substrate-binding protein [Anaerolineae bacterium]